MIQNSISWLKNYLVDTIMCLDVYKKPLGANFKGLKLAPKGFIL